MKTKLTSISAKNKLKSYYRFFESDFYEENGIIYLNCKDSVMIKATDMYEDLTRKEEWELENN